jgi:hypothetical protein
MEAHMTGLRSSTVLAAAVALSGCYHATIETGLPLGTQTLEDQWADSWVYGLVPPETVETAARCPNGVARVETRRSFTNWLVGFLTVGIYTPMEIMVTCAGPDAPDQAAQDRVSIDTDANMAEMQQAFQDAAGQAARAGKVVLIQFE